MTDIPAKDFKKYLVYLFLLGLIIRAAFLVVHAQNPAFGVLILDQKYYDAEARMLLAGADLRPLRGFKPLLYPMFLAVMDKAGGAHATDLAVTLQHLFGVLTGLAVALLGARLFRHRLSGLACGALYLLAPLPLCFESELFIESSYTFLICMGLLVLLRAADATGWKAGLLWAAGGATTMLAAQARPNILALMAVYPLFAAWRWWRSRRPAALLPLLGLMGAAAMAVPWGFVNKMQSGHFQVVPTTGGINLYLANQPASSGIQGKLERPVIYNESFEDPVEVWAREEYAAAMRAQGREPDADPAAMARYWTARAIAEIRAAPLPWLRLEIKRCWLTFWNAEAPINKSFAFLQTEYVLLRVLPVRWVVLLMLAPAGIWAAVKWGNGDALFILLAYVLLYAGSGTLFFICDRYRYPVWPGLAAIGGGGLLVFVESLRHRRWRAVLGLAAGMVLMAVISLPNWFGVQLPSFARDYLFRSVAWYEKGHFREALDDIDRSVALDSTDVMTLQQRGNILVALNRMDEARKDYAQTLKLSPNDAGTWNNYGVALDGLGRTNEALEAFRHAMECRPPSQSAFLGMAFELIRAGRLDEAAGVLVELAKQEKGPDAVALAIRSVIARQRGEAAQAATLEQQARSLDPDAAAWAMERAGNRGQKK